MDTIDALESIKKSIEHTLSTGLPVQFSDRDLMTIADVIGFLSDIQIKPQKEKEKEVCICAAVIADDDSIYRGHRHADCIKGIIASDKIVKHGFDVQGFMTSCNRYVNRREGFELQKASGIPSAWCDGYQNHGVLFSEDLY